MIIIGNLYTTQDPTVGLVLCEVVSTYHKADIDPRCSQSVEMVSMVKARWMSGPNIGRTFSMSKMSFNKRWNLNNDI